MRIQLHSPDRCEHRGGSRKAAPRTSTEKAAAHRANSPARVSRLRLADAARLLCGNKALTDGSVRHRYCKQAGVPARERRSSWLQWAAVFAGSISASQILIKADAVACHRKASRRHGLDPGYADRRRCRKRQCWWRRTVGSAEANVHAQLLPDGKLACTEGDPRNRIGRSYVRRRRYQRRSCSGWCRRRCGHGKRCRCSHRSSRRCLHEFIGRVRYPQAIEHQPGRPGQYL